MENQKTIRRLLENSFENYAQNPALGYIGQEPLTYNQLKERISATVQMLLYYQVQRGDKVAILGRNMPNWSISYFAVTSMGAIAVPILPDFSTNEISNILNHSEAKILIVSQSHKAKIAEDIRKQLIVIEMESIETLIAPSIEVDFFGPHQLNEEDLAAIIYTSGTTGKSKGVMLSHKNLVFETEMVLNIQYIEPWDVFLSILPLSHTYENSLGLILPIMRGASSYYTQGALSSTSLLEAIKKVRPTTMLTVPLIAEKIYRNQILLQINSKPILKFLTKFNITRKLVHYLAGKKLKATFGGRLRFFGIGGAKLDPVVEKFLMEAKFPYAIGYGLTEASPLIAGANPQQVRLESTGPAMKGVTLKINNPDPLTGQGEIWAKGDNIMKGYYKDPAATSEVLTPDGWLKTGDLGYFDKDGWLYLRGRIKNMILSSNGENIYPEEIESLINNFKFVVESLVVEKKGKLVAMVHLNYDELEKQFQVFKGEAMKQYNEWVDEILLEIQTHVNAKVNRYSQLYVIVEQRMPFEKTPTQKIKRFLYQHQ